VSQRLTELARRHGLGDELSDNMRDQNGTRTDMRGQNLLVSRSIDQGQRTAEDRSGRRSRLDVGALAESLFEPTCGQRFQENHESMIVGVLCAVVAGWSLACCRARTT
jgi:hypothetical protein